MAPIGEVRTVVDYSFGDMLRDLVVSGIQEGIVAVLGAGIGTVLAMYALRRARA
jgi:hypothetical protein